MKIGKIIDIALIVVFLIFAIIQFFLQNTFDGLLWLLLCLASWFLYREYVRIGHIPKDNSMKTMTTYFLIILVSSIIIIKFIFELIY
jgi:hypothetical protein